MDKKKKQKAKKLLILAIKISFGSCTAILVAQWLGLEFATSSGIITLLTIMTTKWETLKLSFYRVITFILSVGFIWFAYQFIDVQWIVYGVFIFALVLICEWIGWKSTISVNAVISTHFLSTHNFTREFIINELSLVLIGISIAIVINLFQNNSSQQAMLKKNMNYVEQMLKFILDELANYLYNNPIERNVWDDIIALENDLEDLLEKAYDYQNNTFRSHPNYFIHYFEMRTKQFNILHNLHYEMKKLRALPKQAIIVADYITYIKGFISETNNPKEQLDRLEIIVEEMGKDELPKSKEELESRAKLYHILMDLEEFLIFKKRFIEAVTYEQKKEYWKIEEKKETFKG